MSKKLERMIAKAIDEYRERHDSKVMVGEVIDALESVSLALKGGVDKHNAKKAA